LSLINLSHEYNQNSFRQIGRMRVGLFRPAGEWWVWGKLSRGSLLMLCGLVLVVTDKFESF
jgi:hypothetical protein